MPLGWFLLYARCPPGTPTTLAEARSPEERPLPICGSCGEVVRGERAPRQPVQEQQVRRDMGECALNIGPGAVVMIPLVSPPRHHWESGTSRERHSPQVVRSAWLMKPSRLMIKCGVGPYPASDTPS
jgi:hypothetical protein